MITSVKNLFFLLICLFLYACTPVQWQEYHFANGAVSVSLPQAPKAEPQVLQLGEKSVPFEGQVYTQGEQVYRLNYYCLMPQDNAQQLVSDLLVYTQKILQLPEDKTLQNPHDYRLSNTLSHAGKSNTVKVRIISDNKYLVFAYVFTTIDNKKDDAERFLENVHILDQ